MNDRSILSDGSYQAKIFHLALEAGSARQGRCLDQSEGRVLLNRNRTYVFKRAQQINYTGSSDDDRITCEDRNIVFLAGHWIAAQINNDGLVETQAVNRNDMTGGRRDPTSYRKYVKKTTLPHNGDHGMHIACYGCDLIG